MDVLTPEQRHKAMQHIRGKNTKIEIILRTALWHEGLRYRKNYRKLPGTPDIAITKYKIAVFCDGEFFHGKDWKEQRPRIEKGNNPEFWIKKIERNIQRDKEINASLEEAGWKVLRFWGNDIKKHTDDCVRTVLEAVDSRKNPKPVASFSINDSAELKVAEPDISYKENQRRKTVYVSAAIILRTLEDGTKQVFATQRGYGEFKDLWEFPGGKEEPGETPEQTLIREIKEELDTEISIDGFVDIIEYDYPSFHLSMECYQCSVVSGKLTLLEHENAKWLGASELNTVDWLPADITIMDKIENLLK